MRRSEAMRILTAHREEIERFGVRALSIFGSVARDEAGPESDVDVLVEFERPPSFGQYMALRIFLEDLLATSVDLASIKTLKPRIRSRVEAEAVRVA
ncbi:MAG: nucleotidyltransferase family protein [Chloroflexota bacterium]